MKIDDIVMEVRRVVFVSEYQKDIDASGNRFIVRRIYGNGDGRVDVSPVHRPEKIWTTMASAFKPAIIKCDIEGLFEI